jgi:hypothetical protein
MTARAAYAAILTYSGALMGEGYVPGMIVWFEDPLLCSPEDLIPSLQR